MYVAVPGCSTSLSTQTAAGLGCLGCGGLCGGARGVGDISDTLSSLSDSFSAFTDATGFPWWAFAAAGLALWWMIMPGGSQYREKRRKLASEYRGGRRLSRAVKKTSRKIGESVGVLQ
jgi:hypothetical protein